MKEDKSFGVILINRKENQPDRFLIIQENIGHWSFPKGHPEENETEEETARRELFEETGIKNIDFADFPLLKEEYNYTFGTTDYHKTVKYFIAFTNEGNIKIQEKEISDYLWATYEQVLEKFSFDGQKRILNLVSEYVKLNIEFKKLEVGKEEDI